MNWGNQPDMSLATLLLSRYYDQGPYLIISPCRPYDFQIILLVNMSEHYDILGLLSKTKLYIHNVHLCFCRAIYFAHGLILKC